MSANKDLLLGMGEKANYQLVLPLLLVGFTTPLVLISDKWRHFSCDDPKDFLVKGSGD